jgi:membrane protease YdiL (CAAX protease family)
VRPDPSDSRTTAPPSRQATLALACAAVWVAAAVSTGRLGIWRAFGGAAVALGLVVLAVDRADSGDALRPRLSLILVGAGAGAAMTAATYLVYPGLARVTPALVRETQHLYAAFGAPSRVVAALALAPIIVGEELVWRGVVQAAVARRLGASWGVVLGAAAYALVHAPVGSPVLVLLALTCGLAWGTLRAATGSLVPTVVSHLVWDLVVLVGVPVNSIPFQ